MGLRARFWNLMRGIGLARIEEAEAANPSAMLAVEVDNFNKAQADFNNNLAKQAGLVGSLRRQIKMGQEKVAAGTERLKRLLALGDPQSQEKARVLVLEVQEAEATLLTNKAQEEAAEALFKQLTRQRDVYVSTAKARIDKVRGMIGQAEMAEAQATMAKMASSQVFNPDTGGLSGVEEALMKRIDNANGAVRVATEAQASSPWAESEAEQAARADAALAAFKAKLSGDTPSV